MRLVHRALRGRYRLAAFLVVLLAAGGGTVGYIAIPAKYVSTGIVYIKGASPVILYPTEENKVPPMFETFVAAQQASLGSWQLLAEVVDRLEIAELGWPKGPNGVSKLNDALTITRRRGEHTIFVSVADHNPLLSQAAVNTILAVYRESEPEPAGLSLLAKETVLGQREDDLEAQLEIVRLQILEHSDQFGHISIEQIHASKAAELMEIKQEIKQIKLARRKMEAGALPGQVRLGLTPIDPIIDSTLSSLQKQDLALQVEISSLQTRYAPDHSIFRELEKKQELVRTQLELSWRVQNMPMIDPSISILDGVDRLLETHIQKRDRLLKEAAALGVKKIVMAGLEGQIAEIKDRLTMTRRRLDEIRFETGRDSSERISIVEGGLPGLPSSDRRIGLAGACIIFGSLSGIGIVVLIGLRDPRIRYADELEAMNLTIPIVGLMPDFSSSAKIPAVNQLRHLLQIQRSASNSNVCVLTSCDQSKGRTQISCALAVSFADAGHNTLLIDASFASYLLSRKLELAKRPGLREALGVGNGSDKIYPARHANLSVMPIGSILGVLRKDFNTQLVRRLYDDLRNQYDTIIVDTGPVSCDFDACLITAESDQVVMIVDRNQEQDQIRTAVSRLEQLGVDTAGLLYNSASETEIRSSVDVSKFGTITVEDFLANEDRPSLVMSDMKHAA